MTSHLLYPSFPTRAFRRKLAARRHIRYLFASVGTVLVPIGGVIVFLLLILTILAIFSL